MPRFLGIWLFLLVFEAALIKISFFEYYSIIKSATIKVEFIFTFSFSFYLTFLFFSLFINLNFNDTEIQSLSTMSGKNQQIVVRVANKANKKRKVRKNKVPKTSAARPKQNRGRSKQKRKRTSPGQGKFKKLLSSYYSRCAEQMVNPSKVVSPVVLPDEGASAVCCRKYTRTLAYKQSDYAKLRLAMFPNLFMPGFVAGGPSITVPSAAAGLVVMSGLLKANLDADSNAQAVVNFKDAVGGGGGGTLNPLTDAAGVTRNGFVCSIATGTMFTLFAADKSPASVLQVASPAPIIAIYGAAAGGNWVLFKQTEIIPSRGNYWEVTVPAGGIFTKFALVVGGTKSKDTSIDFAFSFTSAQFVTGAVGTFAPAFGEQIIEEHISQGRVTHMSMLIRNTTAPIYSSGTICAARVPVGFDVGAYSGNWLQSASTLPSNRQYIGPFQTGAYVFWTPEQLDEYQVDNVGEKLTAYRDSSYLVAEVPDWIAGATVEVTFTWVVEFYTPSQNFDKVPTPPMTPEWRMIWDLVTRTPAAMCNPEHESETKAFLNSVKSTLTDIYEFYGENKEMIHLIGEAIMFALAS